MPDQAAMATAFSPMVPTPVLFTVVAVALAIWGWRLAVDWKSRRKSVVVVVGVLRLCSLATLTLVLLNPVESVRQSASADAPATSKPPLTLLVDTSRSMGTRDGGKESRLETIQNRWLTPTHLRRLSETFQIRLRAFDRSPREIDPANGVAGLSASGGATDLRRAIRSAAAEGGRVVVFSDGRDTSGRSADAMSLEPSVTIDALLLGDARRAAIDRPRIALWARPTSLRRGETGWVDVECTGRPGEEGVLQIFSPTVGHPWRVAVRMDASGTGHLPVPVGAAGFSDADWRDAGWRQVDVADDDKGTNSQMAAALSGDADFLKATLTLGGEAVSRELLIPREGSSARVLLLDGAPGWDSRDLVRALATMQDVEVERVIALSDRPGSEPPPPVPATVGGWAKYDAVILGPASDRLIAPEQGRELMRWVTRNGGAVLLTAGPACVTNPGLEWFSALCPVRWTGEFVDGGWLAWPRGEALSRVLVRGRWERADLQPGARVWARLDHDSTSWPAVVECGIGEGRVASVAGVGLWRWWLGGESAEFRRFWRQILFQVLLKRDVGESLRVAVDAVEGGRCLVGHPAIISASSMRPGIPADASMSVSVVGPLNSSPDGAAASIALRREGDSARALWRGAWTPSRPGIYRVTTPSLTADEVAATRLVQVGEVDDELTDVTADPAELARAIESSGGEWIDPNSSGDWSERLVSRATAVARTNAADGVVEFRPRWDRAWVLTLLLASLLFEWAIRRAVGWR